jgi:hypothetical protein
VVIVVRAGRCIVRNMKGGCATIAFISGREDNDTYVYIYYNSESVTEVELMWAWIRRNLKVGPRNIFSEGDKALFLSSYCPNLDQPVVGSSIRKVC